jgi:AraC-like DNA-binding protein
LFITDQSAPYRYSARGTNASCSIDMEYGHLGLPVDVVRKAAERLPASPLYGLVTHHLIALHRDLAQIEADPAALVSYRSHNRLVASAGRVSIGSAALRASGGSRSAAPDDPRLRAPAPARAEPDPQRIADHHNISLRYLYKLCSGADIRLMDWIVQQRLKGAQQDLSHPDSKARTIAGIAHHWGFKDARHFSARVRQSYGLSPREWRASADTIDGHSLRQSHQEGSSPLLLAR